MVRYTNISATTTIKYAEEVTIFIGIRAQK